MSKKKILDYDPKTGFGNFAEIMNANANFPKSPSDSSAEAALEKGEGALDIGAAVGANAGNMASKNTMVTDGINHSATYGANAPAAGVSAGNTGGVSGVTAQPIVGVPGYKGNIGSYEEWMSENGYDPDRDYDEKKAALEYDYETSMATYGRRAEELSQMGLSNSGLSDIYQLGTFNAYLQQQNDIANQRIAAKKKYKQEYNALLKENEAAFKTDSANAYNLGLSLYDGSNIDFVRQQLSMQGYDAGVVDGAISSLSSLDVNSLPLVEAQRRQDDADIQSALSNAINNGYEYEDREKVANTYRAMGWSEDKISALIARLDTVVPQKTEEEVAKEKQDAVSRGLNAFTSANPNFKYDGSESAKETVKQWLRNAGYVDYADDIIAQLDADRQSNMTAQAADLKAALDADNDVAFRNAYSLVGMSKEAWDAMDDDDKAFEIIAKIGEKTMVGEFDANEGATIIQEWYNQSVEDINSASLDERPEMCDELIVRLQTLGQRGALSTEVVNDCVSALEGLKKDSKTKTREKIYEDYIAPIVDILGKAGQAAALGS